VEDERSVAPTASKNEVNGLDIDPQVRILFACHINMLVIPK